MSTEFRQWITETWEYCQEHWIAAAAAGGVLLILLVSAILVFSAKSDDAEEDAPAEVPDEPAVPEETVLPQTQGVMESLLKSVEAASGAAGQKVEAIELKIEKAQLTIHYAGSSRTESVSGITAEKREETVWEDFAGEMAEEEEISVPKKFGQDNMNTARSGRVYTEEELLDQIRD